MSLHITEPEFANSSTLPLVVTPATAGEDLLDCLEPIRELVAAELPVRGGMLFRGFNVEGVKRFEEFVTAFGSPPMTYTFRSTPRRQVEGKVYTSTEYPADQKIPLHNELSYTDVWPLKLWFHAVRVAPVGGATPIADSREIYRRMPEQIRHRFESLGVIYVRNYRKGMDLPWQDVFNASSRDEVDGYCRQHGIDHEWRGDDLRTLQRCSGVEDHPETGERVWFNQAHLFHASTLPEPIRAAMRSLYDESELPRNVLYGDGSPIGDEELNLVRSVLDECAVVFRWQSEDILLLDNMLAAHGRHAYEGHRQVVVSMTEAQQGRFATAVCAGS